MTKLPWAKISAGQVIVEHDIAGPYPVLIPAGGVTMRVNGVVQSDSIAVRKDDSIELETLSEVREGRWSITVSPDNLIARIRVHPKVEIQRTIPDAGPAPHLIIRAEEKITATPPINYDELARALRQEGIIYGLDVASYSEVTSAIEAKEIVIAQGTPPELGTDGEFKVLFEADMKALKDIAEDKEVDFRERFDFTAVAQGQVLAKRIPPTPGKPGTGVHAESIVPPDPRDVTLVPGDGVILQEWDNQLVATRSGRPLLRASRTSVRVDVVPDLVIKGNVDMGTGNVSFVGDVSITGDINAGFSVHAGGAIRVGGVVENALLQACGPISVAGNLISSQIVAGVPPTFLKTVTPILASVREMLDLLLAAVPQLKQRIPASRQALYPQLLNAFMMQKTPDLYDRVKVLSAEFSKLPARLREVLGEQSVGGLTEFLQELDSGLKSDQSILTVHKLILELTERLNSEEITKAYAIAKNVINSTLSAAGQVTIVGGGCYNSRLQAGEKVIVNGVFRGGELRSGGDVSIKELGSESGVLTLVYCPSNAFVSITKAHENSSVIIGPRRYNFDSTQHLVTIRLVDGELYVKKVN